MPKFSKGTLQVKVPKVHQQNSNGSADHRTDWMAGKGSSWEGAGKPAWVILDEGVGPQGDREVERVYFG